jgi:hypothetical protein
MWERFKFWLLGRLIGDKPVIANCSVYDTTLYTQKFYFTKDCKVKSFEMDAEKRAVKMIEKRDNELLIKQGVQRYGNAFVLRTV